jgi:hypothetical protein|tara:strand:- start:15737 stop:16498 length:762 start_codon:yes stop_codon:yes gene_type:complete
MSINQFLAAVKTSGFAKSSRYMVVMGIPRDKSANANGSSSMFGQGNLMSDYTQMNRDANGKFITSLYCEATSMPALNIDTKINKTYGPGREMPYGRSYTPVNFSFYIDRDYMLKKYFDAWQNMIFDKESGHMNFYNEYTCEIHILALDAGDNDGTDGKPLKCKYQCTLQECYPKTVAEIGFAAGNGEIPRLQVSMNYRKWIDTTQAEGLGSTGAHTIFANVKSYDPTTGIFSPDGSSTDTGSGWATNGEFLVT